MDITNDVQRHLDTISNCITRITKNVVYIDQALTDELQALTEIVLDFDARVIVKKPWC